MTDEDTLAAQLFQKEQEEEQQREMLKAMREAEQQMLKDDPAYELWLNILEHEHETK